MSGRYSVPIIRSGLMVEAEVRMIQPGEMRLAEEDGEPGNPIVPVAGYPVKWDSIDGSERAEEVFRRGAFTAALAANEDDIAFTQNHEPSLILARQSVPRGAAGSLELVEDDTGLRLYSLPTDTSYARDLITNIRARVVYQMSFIFKAIDDRIIKRTGKPILREVLKAKLFEVTVATFPWYRETEVEADARYVGHLFAEARAGRLTDAGRARLVAFLDEGRSLAATEEVSQSMAASLRSIATEGDGDPPAEDPAVQLESWQRRIAMAQRALGQVKMEGQR